MLYMKHSSVRVSNGAVYIAELSRESIRCQYGMDEVSILLALREDSEGVNAEFVVVHGEMK